MKVSSVLKQMSPRKMAQPSFVSVNRFAYLSGGEPRSPAPAPNPKNLAPTADMGERSRSNSFKRKFQEGNSYAGAVSGSVAVSAGPEVGTEKHDVNWVNEAGVEIAKVESLCDQFVTEVSNVSVDPALLPVFGLIAESLKGVSKIQKLIVEKVGHSKGNVYTPKEGGMTNLGAIPKKPRTLLAANERGNPGQGGSGMATQGGVIPGSGSGSGSGSGLGNRIPPTPQLNNIPSNKGGTNEGGGRSLPTNGVPRNISHGGNRRDSLIESGTPLEQRFREAIRTAEKSTLIFNLDMGRVPVMNKDTMSKRATLALSAMAAEREKSNTSVPSEDSVETLDDVLSLVKNMEFFGDTTKTYRHPRDKKSGLFCTVPVKYEFRDRDTRMRAETVLRSSCGIQCATPYPVMVKECIRQIVQRVKRQNPGNFVKVTVDTRDLTFKVARKPPDDDPDPGWKYRIGDIPIPEIVMDTSIRRVPRDFVLPIPVREDDTQTPYRDTRRPVAAPEGGTEKQRSPTPPSPPPN
jgi:hypothetical protein